ncbi:hypothetical protein LDG_6193 [Legionella drancourtii LLAP12]|uniref:Uncharacterized protein n=1 Tax=Legionella drancourtii LLAP12 TaxID=658187 RepID=G9ELD0_9GAMM|nr:hypothetical protein LDG_6193 [Legionella drancourtii LLAP12]
MFEKTYKVIHNLQGVYISNMAIPLLKSLCNTARRWLNSG